MAKQSQMAKQSLAEERQFLMDAGKTLDDIRSLVKDTKDMVCSPGAEVFWSGAVCKPGEKCSGTCSSKMAKQSQTAERSLAEERQFLMDAGKTLDDIRSLVKDTKDMVCSPGAEVFWSGAVCKPGENLPRKRVASPRSGNGTDIYARKTGSAVCCDREEEEEVQSFGIARKRVREYQSLETALLQDM